MDSTSQRLMMGGKKGKSEFVAVSHANSPYITVYPWSSSGFGTKFSDPATLPTNDGYAVGFGAI